MWLWSLSSVWVNHWWILSCPNLADVAAVANPVSTDPNAIASNIKYHANFTPSFSPFKFELQQAYVATAESLRDALVQRWNETYKHFTKENAKTIHYLSMEFLQVSQCPPQSSSSPFNPRCNRHCNADEKSYWTLLGFHEIRVSNHVWFLQGRALLNAVGNLELKDAYSEALHKLGHDLEAVAEQVNCSSPACFLFLAISWVQTSTIHSLWFTRVDVSGWGYLGHVCRSRMLLLAMVGWED